MEKNHVPIPRRVVASSDEAQVIDLPAVIPAVALLLAFYDDLARDADPPIEQLDRAVRRIQALPAIPGRLGRDIRLMSNGGRGANRIQIVEALTRLRNLTNMTKPEAGPGPGSAKD